MSSKKETVSEKLEKLEALLAWFESEEITIEESIAKYEEALQLAKDVEDQIEQAKNQVEVIKQQFAS
jgi:exodeoxyribonuclease VII small subunit